MVAGFSQWVAMPRHCLRRLMHRSTVLGCLQVSPSKAGGLPPRLPVTRLYENWDSTSGRCGISPPLR
ncbi:hypothetical protein C0Q57_30920 [Streptomyces albidoflavus]|nr:hypothetical protein C0Q57_30920 [Streptomyces albidoflavus]